MEYVEEYLNILEPLIKDESVTEIQWRELDADAITSINSQTEITITYQNNDAWYYPSRSYLIIEGNISTTTPPSVTTPTNTPIAAIVGPPAFPADTAYAGVTFVNNGLMQMFDTVRYYLGGQQVEYFQNCGITTTIHNLLTRPKDFQALDMMWYPDEKSATSDLTNCGYAKRWLCTTHPIQFNNRTVPAGPNINGYTFGCIVPLSHIFNFCQDYNKVIYGMQHRLSLQRRSDSYALYCSQFGSQNYVQSGDPYLSNIMGQGTNNYTINLTKLRWAMPTITPSEEQRLRLGKIITDRTECNVPFLNKRFEAPNTVIAGQSSFTWKLQLSGGYEKPRFIAVAFQAVTRSVTVAAVAAVAAGQGSIYPRPGVVASNGYPPVAAVAANTTSQPGSQSYNDSVFDAPDVYNAYVLLNGKRYPYADVQSSIVNDTQEKWLRFYKDFRNYYSGKNCDDTAMDKIQFQQNPIFVFDVSKQEEKLKTGTVDVTLYFQFNTNPPVNYNAYAVVYFDALYKLTGDANRQILTHFN